MPLDLSKLMKESELKLGIIVRGPVLPEPIEVLVAEYGGLIDLARADPITGRVLVRAR
jgi:hypothetical protein